MRHHAVFAFCLALLPLLAPASAPAADESLESATAKLDPQQKQAVQKVLDDPAKAVQALTGKGATSFPGAVVPQNQQQPGQPPAQPPKSGSAKAIYGDIIIYK